MNSPVTACASCGAPIAQGAKFCPQCGSPVALPASADGSCAACGHINRRPGGFCEECGARLGAVLSAQSARPLTASSPSAAPSFRREPWHYAAAGLLLGVVALFVWIESGRVTAPAGVQVPAVAPPPAAKPNADLARLEAAVAANPSDTGSLLALANMLHDLSRQDASLIDAAIARYTEYLALKPADPDARVDLGIMLFEKARSDSAGSAQFVDRAVAEMERVARDNPAHQPAALNLGIVNLNAGRSDEALRWFRRTVEIAPGSELGMRAARLLEQHGGTPPAR